MLPFSVIALDEVGALFCSWESASSKNKIIVLLNQFPESLSNQNFSFCCLSVYCVRGRRNSFVTDELGQTQGRRRRKKTESVPLKQICCSWKLFRQKLVFLFLEKKQGRGQERRKGKRFFHCFLTCFCHLYSPIIFKRSFVLRGATFIVAFL